MNLVKRLRLGLRRRIRETSKKAQLGLRRKLSGGTLWIDYGWMRLPYHADGDQQEVYYHMDGAAWWENEREVLEPYVRPGAVVVDVGANLGFLTALFSKLVSPGGTVHSFEPSPVTFGKLQEVIARNGLKNVRTHNVGCGEREEELELFYTVSSGNSTLQRPEQAGGIREVQKVAIVRLDDYLLPQLSRLDLLKIDTEGHEDAVLAGASELLRRFRPVIYLELTSEFLESSRRAVGLLKALGYRFITEPVLEECHNGQNFIVVPT